MRAETQGKKANVRICLEKGGTEQSGKGNQTGHDQGSEGDLAHVDARSGTRVCGRAAGTGSGGRSARGSASGGTASSRGGGNGVSTSILGTGTSETGALTSTRGHVLLGVIGDGGKILTGEGTGVPGAARGRAGGRSVVRVVAAVTSGCSVVSEGSLEVGEVAVGGDSRARDSNETVVGALLGVLVDETTAVNTGHLRVVESRDLLELASVLVAAVFGEEEGQTVVAVGGNLLVPARDGVGRRVAPRVVVEGEEVAALVVGTAVHVLGSLVAVLADIGSRVTNGNGAVASVVAVLLEITSNGLNVRSAVGSVDVVDDLVTGEEKKSVGVVGECIDSSEQTLQVNSVV
jgi:hypothetical protein